MIIIIIIVVVTPDHESLEQKTFELVHITVFIFLKKDLRLIKLRK